jgi:cell division protein FtsB
VVGAAVFLFVALLGIAAWKGSRDLAAARERERLLETRIEETRGRIDGLRGRIDRLRSDPGTLERLAREDLGMVRPGDVIIELPPDLPGGQTPAPQKAAAPLPPASPR